jgi:hypothetical protein
VTGAGAPAKRRRARALLCATFALAGIATVLAIAEREPAWRDAERGAGDTAPGVAALPAAVSTHAAAGEARAVAVPPAQPLWQPPVMAPRARRDEGSVESTSFEGDWREPVAAVLGRKAVEGLPQNPGAVHTHLMAEGLQPEARAPVVQLPSAPTGTEGFEGWDGGKFWFGPNGLVRMKEVQP